MKNEIKEETMEVSKPKKKRSKVIETIETIFIAFALVIVFRPTIAEARYIPSESMLPTLEIGDKIIVEKLSNYTVPKRGEIIVFYPVEGPQAPYLMRWFGFTMIAPYVKRVIGLPGETIAIENEKVYINGKPLDEKYVKDPPFYTMAPVKIPSDSIFMMGDNRNNSRDSHVWGPLPMKNILGHACMKFWPPGRIGLL